MVEEGTSTEPVKRLPDRVFRGLVVADGRRPMFIRGLDDDLVANQRLLGRDTDNYAAMVSVHQRNSLPPGQSGNERYLGIHEEVTRRFELAVNGETIEVQETEPFSRIIWVGDNVRIISATEAAEIPHAGKTALYWAMMNNEQRIPESVVRASDGYYYPAHPEDITVPAFEA
ncbi:MAG: hypothetical protein HYV38_00745 [Candidatus Levybacteria bacterium]|nr:hypothetical protein [Candidatus Levybacteria bacterium]